MADFKTAHDETMGNEGGCSFNPADKGNVVEKGVVTIPTYKGIAPVFWPSWRGFLIITRQIGTMNKMPPYGTREYRNWVAHLDKLLAALSGLQDLVLSFYRVNFWDKYRCGEIESQQVASWLYDHAVNGGARGAQWIQTALGLTVDGDIGPKSLAAINSADPGALILAAREVAKEFRLERVRKHPDQKQFLHSWLTRDGFSDAEVHDIIATV